MTNAGSELNGFWQRAREQPGPGSEAGVEGREGASGWTVLSLRCFLPEAAAVPEGWVSICREVCSCQKSATWFLSKQSVSGLGGSDLKIVERKPERDGLIHTR